MPPHSLTLTRRDALGLLGLGVASLAAAACTPGATPPAPTPKPSPTSSPGSAPAAFLPSTSPALLTRRIPSSGEPLPLVGLGTWQTFDVGPDAARRAPLAEVLSAFAALGGKVVDSSPMYGHAEGVLGDLSSSLRLRPKLFVATKVWTTGRAAGITQMEASLRKLQTNGVDLMQVHNLLDVATHLDTLAGWKREGRVRYVGVTHYTAASHDAVAALVASRPLDFIQINYSAGETDADRRLLPLARDRGVAVIANRPFGGGGQLRRLRSKPLPDWAAEVGCTSWAQLLLKFVVSHPAVTCAIPATASVEHLRENMLAGREPLPDARLRALIAGAVG